MSVRNSNPASLFNPLSNLGTFAPSSGVTESTSQRLAAEVQNRVSTGGQRFSFSGREKSGLNYYLLGALAIVGYVAWRVTK